MKLKTCFVSLCLCVLSLLAASAHAIELSLEENRAERGSVGFVDMKRLFAASPDAARAREGLEELVRQAEERVNAKKAEILRLRQDLGSLKSERDELAQSTPTTSVPVPAPPPAKAPAMPGIETASKPIVVDTAPVTALPAAAPVAASTQTAPLTINLPGLTDGPLDLERPGVSPLNPTRDRGTPQTPPEPAPVAITPPVATAPTPPAPTGPTLAQRLLELDGRIVAKQGEFDRLQGELDRERLGAENALLDAEGRKTDQVLARLYRAISEVAKREGVSVVVDKSATLYGHPAVDLTDKILKQLRGVVPAQ